MFEVFIELIRQRKALIGKSAIYDNFLPVNATFPKQHHSYDIYLSIIL
jgi:hypothetical protein